MILRVDAAARTLSAGGEAWPCAIGRGGAVAAADKREGGGATPLGRWPLRAALLRPGRFAPPAALAWRWLRPGDGWSDEPADPAYNRPVRHPHRFSAERLWREDGLYDAIVVLGHNDAPPVAGLGSAIFLHVWKDGAATEGCVAVAADAMARLLTQVRAGDVLEITWAPPAPAPERGHDPADPRQLPPRL